MDVTIKSSISCPVMFLGISSVLGRFCPMSFQIENRPGGCCKNKIHHSNQSPVCHPLVILFYLIKTNADRYGTILNIEDIVARLVGGALVSKAPEENLESYSIVQYPLDFLRQQCSALGPTDRNAPPSPPTNAPACITTMAGIPPPVPWWLVPETAQRHTRRRIRTTGRGVTDRIPIITAGSSNTKGRRAGRTG
jgi:hypothetical protein